ncbi:MAG: sulfite exporter TauE/SafE family protein, partial [Alphaproteobacteria bacterium]|nr:sulfite exporter TauE/SafE family protein [Alphaproteobacteria bacterium]
RALLVVYCLYVLTAKQPPIIPWGGRRADGVVGFLGGVMGGLASIPGPLPAIWSGLRGWTKDEQRGVIQIFNLVMLGFAVLAHNVNGRFETLALSTAAIALGCATMGCLIGIAVYHRTSERNFRRIVLILLLVSGLSHLGSVLF